MTDAFPMAHLVTVRVAAGLANLDVGERQVRVDPARRVRPTRDRTAAGSSVIHLVGKVTAESVRSTTPPDISATCRSRRGPAVPLIGALGRIPGITLTTSSPLRRAQTEAALLGFVNDSILHNAIYLLFGVAGLVLVRRSLLSAGV
jgi:hypothetical protein